MRGEIKITIPEPCGVPWDSMKFIDEKKRHCSSCDRVIHDFTKMSDAELVKFLATNGKVCGQFSDYQLNRNLVPAEIHRPQKWPLALLLSTLLFSVKSPAKNSSANLPVQTQQNNFSPPLAIEPLNGDSRIIEGTVVDSLTNDSLAGAIVWIETNGKQFSCQTDSSGKFRISLPESGITDSTFLHINYSGYESFAMHLNAIGSNAVLRMKQSPQKEIIIVGGRVETIRVGEYVYGGIPQIIDTPSVRKHSRFRHFFYRIFHWR